MTQPTARQLRTLARVFTSGQSQFGDLDAFAIFVCCAHRAAEHPDLPGLSVHGISVSLDIPYETTRRKVLALIERGLLRRVLGGGGVQLTDHPDVAVILGRIGDRLDWLYEDPACAA